MLTGTPPFYETDREKLFKSISSQDPEWPKDVSAECISLLNGLLTKDPHARLGCGEAGSDEIRSHPWFSPVEDWEALK